MVASSIGWAVWRLGNALTLVCLQSGSGAGGGFGVGLGSTSVTLVIGSRSTGIMEGDPASFQTWNITPADKPGSTDWTPIQGRNREGKEMVNSGYSGVLGRRAEPHCAAARQHYNPPGRLLNSAHMQSSASSSPSHRPSASRAILNSRRRSGVRQIRISAEHHLVEEDIGLSVGLVGLEGKGGGGQVGTQQLSLRPCLYPHDHRPVLPKRLPACPRGPRAPGN